MQLEEIRQRRAAERLSKMSSGPDLAKPGNKTLINNPSFSPFFSSSKIFYFFARGFGDYKISECNSPIRGKLNFLFTMCSIPPLGFILS